MSTIIKLIHHKVQIVLMRESYFNLSVFFTYVFNFYQHIKLLDIVYKSINCIYFLLV